MKKIFIRTYKIPMFDFGDCILSDFYEIIFFQFAVILYLIFLLFFFFINIVNVYL